MTLGEFRCWLDGFSYSFNVTRTVDQDVPGAEGIAPDVEQWNDILRKLDTVTVPMVEMPVQTSIPTFPPGKRGWEITSAQAQAPATPPIINPLAAGSYLGLQADVLTKHAPSPDESDVEALAQAVEHGDEESFAAIKARIDAKRASD